MMRQQLTIEAHIDGEVFTEFAVFDVLRRRKRWRRPLFFAASFTALSLAAFSQRAKDPQAVLLGGVLLGLALLLPAAYFLSFFLSVRRRARVQKPEDAAYTLVLDEGGLSVRKGAQTAQFAWAELDAAYRLRRCICLYPDKTHAFLLPQSCGEALYRAAWACIAEHIAPDKLRDRRNEG